jgi:hypothetical protein
MYRMKPVNEQAMVDVNFRNKTSKASLVPQKYLRKGLDWPTCRYIRMCISRALRSYVDSGLRPPRERRRVGAYKRFLGCGIITFAEHLQSLWHNEMSWDNYGSLWELHFIRPLSDWDMSVDANMLAGFHYKNIEPQLCSDRSNSHRKEVDPYEYLRDKATFPPHSK